jgi:uncharacterized protein (UPF0332 family)
VKPELAALARHRLAQAHETLAEAEQLLASQALRGAVNRLYYAAFYAARALLALREVDAARHSGVISLFQQHYVKTGLVAAETGKILARAFEKRQNSDYEDFATVEPADAQDLASAVQTFVDTCKLLLDRLLRDV